MHARETMLTKAWIFQGRRPVCQKKKQTAQDGVKGSMMRLRGCLKQLLREMELPGMFGNSRETSTQDRWLWGVLVSGLAAAAPH